MFRRSGPTPKTTTQVGATEVSFNKEATRWLGVWLEAPSSN